MSGLPSGEAVGFVDSLRQVRWSRKSTFQHCVRVALGLVERIWMSCLLLLQHYLKTIPKGGKSMLRMGAFSRSKLALRGCPNIDSSLRSLLLQNANLLKMQFQLFHVMCTMVLWY